MIHVSENECVSETGWKNPNTNKGRIGVLDENLSILLGETCIILVSLSELNNMEISNMPWRQIVCGWELKIESLLIHVKPHLKEVEKKADNCIDPLVYGNSL